MANPNLNNAARFTVTIEYDRDCTHEGTSLTSVQNLGTHTFKVNSDTPLEIPYLLPTLNPLSDMVACECNFYNPSQISVEQDYFDGSDTFLSSGAYISLNAAE